MYKKAFIWTNLTPRIKHEIKTMCNSFEKGRLKNVDKF